MGNVNNKIDNTKYTGAGCIVLSPDHKQTLLVCQSDINGFPKGHREKKDISPKDTAIRELEEETGLVADDYNFHEEAFEICVVGYIFFYVTLKKDVPFAKARPKNEISSVQWIPIDELVSIEIKANRYLNQWIRDMRHPERFPKRTVTIYRNLH